jgi:hypothetical protein
MAEPHVLTALYDKYAVVMGALRQCECKADKHRADLEHIEATIKLFKPEWTGDGIKPRKAHRASRWPGRGAGMKTALSILRTATEPLTTRQIVLMVLERHNMPEPELDELKLICASFNGALPNRIGRGVRLVDGHPKRWAIEGGDLFHRFEHKKNETYCRIIKYCDKTRIGSDVTTFSEPPPQAL